jgi:hypothetical protein
MYIKRLLTLCLFLMAFSIAEAQTLYIQKGKRKIKILTGSEIVIRTSGDTAKLIDDKKPAAFVIKNITNDSIEISKPTAWKDTFSYKFISNKKRFYKKPVQYEYRKYSLIDVSQIKYTYQRDQSGVGCAGCILVPGLNIYYFWIKANRTKVFDMAEWKFIWK